LVLGALVGLLLQTFRLLELLDQIQYFLLLPLLVVVEVEFMEITTPQIA
jgi:hypothetical protein